jgi:hypothetical protein
MSQINKEGMKNGGRDMIEMIKGGAPETLIMTFATNPEMYTNDPGCLHDHIDLLMNMNFTYVCSIFNTISQKHPDVLVPYAKPILEKIQTNGNMGPIILMCMKEIAAASPNTVYPLIPDIIRDGSGVTGSTYSMAAIFTRCAKASAPGAANSMFLKLIEILKSTEPAYVASVLVEISNVMHDLSDITLLQERIPLISKHRSSSEIVVKEIEDFAAGLSLRKLAEKIDEVNSKVAATCQNFDDVIRYVDENMKDSKLCYLTLYSQIN